MTSVGVDRAAELFVGGNVCEYLLPARSDFSDFIELMEAVEALCPVWPERAAIREEGAVYKL
jgi:hypothetical protein